MLYFGESVLMRLFSNKSASASERVTVVSRRAMRLTMRAMRDAPLALFVFSDEDPSSPLRTPAIQSVGAAIQNMVLEAETRGIASLWCCDILYAYEVSISILGDDGDLMAAVVLGYEDRITPRKTHKTPDQVLTTFCRE